MNWFFLRSLILLMGINCLHHAAALDKSADRENFTIAVGAGIASSLAHCAEQACKMSGHNNTHGITEKDQRFFAVSALVSSMIADYYTLQCSYNNDESGASIANMLLGTCFNLLLLYEELIIKPAPSSASPQNIPHVTKEQRIQRTMLCLLELLSVCAPCFVNSLSIGNTIRNLSRYLQLFIETPKNETRFDHIKNIITQYTPLIGGIVYWLEINGLSEKSIKESRIKQVKLHELLYKRKILEQFLDGNGNLPSNWTSF